MELKVKGALSTPMADPADWVRSVIRGALAEWLEKARGPFHRKGVFEVNVSSDGEIVFCELLVVLGKETFLLRGFGPDLSESLKQTLVQLRRLENSGEKELRPDGWVSEPRRYVGGSGSRRQLSGSSGRRILPRRFERERLQSESKVRN